MGCRPGVALGPPVPHSAVMANDDPESLLARAREHCFMAGIGDVGEQLCAAKRP